MSYKSDDEFTRDLNDRIKELENMSNELNDQTQEMEDFASKGEETDATTNMGATDTTITPRTEGGTIFFTADVDASEPLKLHVTNNNGDIHVNGGDVRQIEIKAVKEGGDDSDHADWFFQALGNEVTLRPNWQVSSQLGELANKFKDQLKEGFSTRNWSKKDFTFGMDVQYDLTVTLPKTLGENSRVTIKTANGDIHVVDVASAVDAKTANGDVSAERIGGNVTANSANGDVRVGEVTGQVGAATANGDLNLQGVVGSIEANTANGDIRIERARSFAAARTANGDVTITESELLGGRVTTVAGDISVDAALSGSESYAFDSVSGEVSINASVPGGGATFSGKSLRGEVTGDTNLTEDGRNAWKLGDGSGPKVTAKTVSSDIRFAATIDSGLEATSDSRPDEEKQATAEFAAPEQKDKDVNVNLDFELERAKGWVKDISSKLGQIIEGTPTRPRKDVEAPAAPEAPVAPEAPQAPAAPEQPATAERRQRLLEAVKNGEMTVDEALAELDKA